MEMSQIDAMIQSFADRGIELIPNPPKLTVLGADRLTDEDRQLIRANKPELLDWLI